MIEDMITRYIKSYNSRDIEGMLDCVTEDVVFENISNHHWGFSILMNALDGWIRRKLPLTCQWAISAVKMLNHNTEN